MGFTAKFWGAKPQPSLWGEHYHSYRNADCKKGGRNFDPNLAMVVVVVVVVVVRKLHFANEGQVWKDNEMIWKTLAVKFLIKLSVCLAKSSRDLCFIKQLGSSWSSGAVAIFMTSDWLQNIGIDLILRGYNSENAEFIQANTTLTIAVEK